MATPLDFLFKSAPQRAEELRQSTLQDTLSRLREGFVGQRAIGPPEATGEAPFTEGLVAPSPQSQFVSELLRPETATQGIQAALGLLEQQRKTQAEQAGGDIDPVQASSILPDGTVQIVRRSGQVDVTTPEDANVEKIKSAQRFGAELQGLRAGERGAATESIKASANAFKGLVTARQFISSMDEGIKLIDQGAGVGAIESRFPSFKEASVKLDNLQARMGLNVIQNTTFGSLSEAELKFALSTALPQGLNSQELRQWMVEKRTAQDKLSTYLEEAAVFLGTPGNTIADFIRQKRTAVFTQGAGAAPTGFPSLGGLPSIGDTSGLPPLGSVPPPPPGFK